MPVRALIELLHIAVGVLATLLLAWLAAWSVPNARESITLVAWIVVGVVVLSGLWSLRRARDHGRVPQADDAASDV